MRMPLQSLCMKWNNGIGKRYKTTGETKFYCSETLSPSFTHLGNHSRTLSYGYFVKDSFFQKIFLQRQ